METIAAPDAATQVSAFAAPVVENVERVIVGKSTVVRTALAAVLAGGHVLMEDAPGTGKTVLARSIAVSLGLDFKRIQCTPDLLPSDVTGAAVFNQAESRFEFRPGPVFANIVLVDELNRATPRTQSALLECMAERQVTLDNVTHALPRPFQVFATQNPFEYEGTFPLPEAQLDRFAVRIRLGYPGEDEEIQVVKNARLSHPLEALRPVTGADQVMWAQTAVRAIHVADDIHSYIVKLVRATRHHADVHIGASPRAAMALAQMAQAVSAISGRDFVTPDVVRFLAPMVLEHRLSIKPEARIQGRSATTVVQSILERMPAPTPGRP